MTTESESRLEIRELVMEDYEAVKHLQEVCFPQIGSHQINIMEISV